VHSNRELGEVEGQMLNLKERWEGRWQFHTFFHAGESPSISDCHVWMEKKGRVHNPCFWCFIGPNLCANNDSVFDHVRTFGFDFIYPTGVKEVDLTGTPSWRSVS
jgi:hypothetical protein